MPTRSNETHERIITVSRKLSRRADALSFGEPVTHVYNPLRYARKPHEAFLRKYARSGVEALLLGMNPGPFGMAQTGVPFGEVAAVRDWLKIDGAVSRPEIEHEKRPIEGFACRRSEVSGRRLWGWARDRFGTPTKFFRRFFVWNYCPLVFMEEGGRNRTPDKLATDERDELYAVCDQALGQVMEVIAPERVIGIGKFAQDRARRALGREVEVNTILHPSPASPIANRGWAPQVNRQLEAMGIR